VLTSYVLDLAHAVPDMYRLSTSYKLSCRREAARCFLSMNIYLSHSRSHKIIGNRTIRFDRSQRSSYWRSMVLFRLFIGVLFWWLCVFGGLCVDMWRLVHQQSFLLFLLSFDCFWLFLTIGVPIVTGLLRLYQQCTNCVPIVKNSQKTVKLAKMTVGVPIVTCLHRVRRIHKAFWCQYIRIIVTRKSHQQQRTLWPIGRRWVLRQPRRRQSAVAASSL